MSCYQKKMSIVTFDDLIALPVLRKFYWLAWRLFRIKVGLIAPNGVRMVTMGIQQRPNHFCHALQQRAGLKACTDCDRTHVQEALRRQTAMRYKCFAGLTEFITPITLDNEIIAFLQTGQVLDRRPTARDWQRTAQTLIAAGIPPAPLRSRFFAMPVLSRTAQTDIVNLLELLGNYIAESQRQQTQLRLIRFSSITERAQLYIRDHLTDPLTLDDIAAAACTSKRNLARLFKAEVGRTALQFIHKERVARAETLLQTTHHTCLRIANDCGFGTLQQFNRVFKRTLKMTPNQCRKKQRQVRRR